MIDAGRQNLKQILQQPDEEIDLAEAALMVARLEYPDLDIPTCLDEIQQLADEISHRLPENPNAGHILNQLNLVLFVEKGFAGNSDNYYDPRNSFLNDVVETRKGIPISLSILYMEIGDRLGLPLSGVAFPGHFLVKLELDDGAIVLDPYFGGISLTEEDLDERLHEFYGDNAKKLPYEGLLATSSKKDIILRVMRNLRNLYMESEQWEKALVMADQMVGLDSDSSDAIKARAVIYDNLECFGPALEDYKSYIGMARPDREYQFIRYRMIELSEACRHIS